MQKRLVPFIVAVLSVIASAVRVEAHAFLVRAEPRVGSKLDKAPTEVRIWFSESVEPASSSIKVFDGQGKQVDKKDTHADPSNHAVLDVSLTSGLKPGSYRVSWRVMSVDTHVTNGDFRFQIVGAQAARSSGAAN
jgi:copper resistance protein C